MEPGVVSDGTEGGLKSMPVSPRIAASVEWMWRSDATVARCIRFALRPIEFLFESVVARRNAAFDASYQGGRADGTPRKPPLPALSVGNLTVGGTGKTPIAAWCVQQLRARGARPAVVLRGYGDDEWRVHALLNPGVSVVVAPDRSAGLLTARVQGADCAVLDDAFQHRQVARVADVVLVSADSWRDDVRLLPAGPFREPLESLRRADVIVISAKAASATLVTQTVQAVTRAAPRVPIAILRLQPDLLALAVSLPAHASTRKDSTVAAAMTHRAAWLNGRTIVVATAIGDADAFVAQLRALGATVAQLMRFPDHHAFSSRDALRIADAVRAVQGDTAGAVCTLKDAVKLAPLWPREAPALWYVSQTVVVERGAEAMDRAFARVLAARAGTAPTAG
jgi:tetraacyldisaccharide 4'-kinase